MSEVDSVLHLSYSRFRDDYPVIPNKEKFILGGSESRAVD
jgi:hypothetical protein